MTLTIKYIAIIQLLVGAVVATVSCDNEPTGIEPRRTQGSRSGPILLTVDFSEETVSGNPVIFVTRLANTGDVTQIFDGPPIFEVYVTRADGVLLWNNLHGFGVPAISIETPLDPGEAFVREIRWEGITNGGARVAPGNYSAYATFWLTDEPDLKTDPRALRIVN